MEYDYGSFYETIDPNDEDFRQDYSNYTSSHPKDMNFNVCVDVSEPMPEVMVEKLDDTSIGDQQLEQGTTKMSKHQRRRDNKKKNTSKTKYVPTNTDMFNSFVLSCGVKSICESFPLPKLSETFSSPHSYYDYMMQLCFEECRACISQEVEAWERGTPKQCRLTLEDITSESMQNTFMLHFKITSSNIETINFRTGSVFALTRGDKFYFALIHVPQQVERGMLSHKPGDVIYLKIKDDTCSSIPKLYETESEHFKMRAEWSARSCGSVISFQRMTNVCFDRPKILFMNKLIGAKEKATHIKFGSDDDDEKKDGDDDSGDDSDCSEDGQSDVKCSPAPFIQSPMPVQVSGQSISSIHSEDFYSLIEEAKLLQRDGDIPNTFDISSCCGVESATERQSVSSSRSMRCKEITAMHDIINHRDSSSMDASMVTQYVGQESSSKKRSSDVLSEIDCISTEKAHYRRLLQERGSAISAHFIDSLNPSQKAALRHCTQDSFVVSQYHAQNKKRRFQRHSGSSDDDVLMFRSSPLPSTSTEVVFKSTSGVGTLSIVQGPPGCGKTHLLASLLHVFFTAGCRILVCAPSNKAVCVALEKYLWSLRGVGGARKVDRKFCPRIAIVGVEDKIDSCSNVVEVGTDFHSVTDEPQNVLDVLSSQYNVRIAKSIVMILEKCDFNRYFLHYNPIDVMSMNDCRSLLKAVAEFGDLHSVVFERVKERIPKVMKKHKMDSDHDAISTDLQALERMIKLSLNIIQEGGNVSVHKLKTGVEDTVKNVKRLLMHLKKDYSSEVLTLAIADEYIQTADILFCTLSTSGNVAVTRNFQYIDMLIIDEAAQAFEPELLIPLALQPDNMILVGDPKQLPATIISQAIHRENLGLSCMQRLMQGCKYPYKMLSIQYRMHPEISQFSNKQFYKGKIFDSLHVKERCDLLRESAVKCNYLNFAAETADARWLTGNYSFINVNGTEQRVAHMGNSLENVMEAELVLKLVMFLKDFCGLNPSTQICIIAFYAAQVSKIKQLLGQSKHGLSNERIKVLSVDSFQGSECDCVILSFVRSNDINSLGFVKEYQRLNVALTRGKHLLLSVGNERTLSSARGVSKKDLNGKHESVTRVGSSASLKSSDVAEYDEDELLQFNSINSLRDMVQDARDRGRVFEKTDVELSMQTMTAYRRGLKPLPIPKADSVAGDSISRKSTSSSVTSVRKITPLTPSQLQSVLSAAKIKTQQKDNMTPRRESVANASHSPDESVQQSSVKPGSSLSSSGSLRTLPRRSNPTSQHIEQIVDPCDEMSSPINVLNSSSWIDLNAVTMPMCPMDVLSVTGHDAVVECVTDTVPIKAPTVIQLTRIKKTPSSLSLPKDVCSSDGIARSTSNPAVSLVSESKGNTSSIVVKKKQPSFLTEGPRVILECDVRANKETRCESSSNSKPSPPPPHMMQQSVAVNAISGRTTRQQSKNNKTPTTYTADTVASIPATAVVKHQWHSDKEDSGNADDAQRGTLSVCGVENVVNSVIESASEVVQPLACVTPVSTLDNNIVSVSPESVTNALPVAPFKPPKPVSAPLECFKEGYVKESRKIGASRMQKNPQAQHEHPQQKQKQADVVSVRIDRNSVDGKAGHSSRTFDNKKHNQTQARSATTNSNAVSSFNGVPRLNVNNSSHRGGSGVPNGLLKRAFGDIQGQDNGVTTSTEGGDNTNTPRKKNQASSSSRTVVCVEPNTFRQKTENQKRWFN